VYVAPFERFYGLYLRADGKHVFFLNKLFVVPEDVGIEKVWYSDTDAVTDMVATYLDTESPLGVDKDLRVEFLLPLMQKMTSGAVINASLAVDLTRGVKDLEEQEKMRASSAINDAAMKRFRGLIQEGVTEKEVAEQMLSIYRELGADGFSFEPLVAFGANAADPHHAPDDTMIKPGDAVLFDVGCIKDGYCSDMTRTFYFQEVKKAHQMIYDIVRKANEKAIAKVRPDVPLCELDKTARDVITEAGYGPYFTHRLGHFIGLSEHEYGDVSSTNTRKAKAGMIFSIEPGIYLAGDTGVRIEDLVLVTEDGCEVLNHASKEFELLG
ncbi:MAG: aminopeptidase P family protein, partial [Lachnospiraceae bacterium]|nr:aminopeptidase P family protein [Lachnospiraceae bacterium]